MAKSPNPFEQAGRFACILFDKTFKSTLCRPEHEDLLRDIFELLIPGKKISRLKLGPTEQSGLVFQEKKVIFDVMCTDADTGEEFIVELQVAEQHSYRDRMLCYATYPIREQLALKLKDRKTQESIDRMDYTLRPVYVISMVYFPFQHKDSAALEENGLISRYSVRNDLNGEPMTEALHFVYLELDRLPYGEEESSRCRNLLEMFAFSLKFIHRLKEQPANFRDPLLNKLFTATELASMTIAQRENYEHEMRTELDIIAERQFAVEQAEARGEARGEVRGEAKQKAEIAKAMLADKVAPEVVAKYTGLTLEEIQQLL